MSDWVVYFNGYDPVHIKGVTNSRDAVWMAAKSMEWRDKHPEQELSITASPEGMVALYRVSTNSDPVFSVKKASDFPKSNLEAEFIKDVATQERTRICSEATAGDKE